MLNLLKIEWLKIKNYGAFKILAIFFGIGVVATNFIVYSINKNIVEQSTAGAMLSSFSPYNFTNTWQSTSYATGYLLLLPAMLIMMLITNEYSFRTNRQNIIDGWSRHEFISVKLMMAFIIAFLSALLVLFTAFGFGLASGSSFSLNGFSHVGYFFLKALSYNMFAVLVSVLIKKTGFAIGLFFIYLGAENILSQMLDFWSVKLKMDKTADLGSLGDYLPMNAADGLLTFPDNPIKSLAKGTLPTDYTWVVFGFAIVYLCLFIWWSRKKYMKADL
jgi:ABC-2 type transport system permease protein